MNWKKLLSYFVPINIYQKKSEINKSLEITWNNGKLVLDTENTNYSYGSLEKVLRKGLFKIGFEKIRSYNSILVLGVAGGCVIKTLANEIKFEGNITAVEIDSDIIELANQYFGLNKFKNLTIIIDDAEQFVKKTQNTYNLVIVDIFQDNVMPDFLFQENFVINLQKIINADGIILFNTIATTMIEEIRNDRFVKQMQIRNTTVERFPNIEGKNELLILKNKI